jgi:hypothetical protein
MNGACWVAPALERRQPCKFCSPSADKGYTLNMINRGQQHMPQIVAFTDGTFYECCRPGGDGNKGMKLKDFEVRAL